jgi:hypothetical protein
MRLRMVVLAGLMICLALVGGSAWADSVPVSNGSFESISGTVYACGTGCEYTAVSVPGWNVTGLTGSFEPGGFFGSVPDGNFIGYSNSGTLSQDLGALQPNLTYTLSIFVGDRIGETGMYTASLMDGSKTLCMITGDSSTITPGGFADETCSFSTGSTPIGDLTILLSAGPSGQFDFDNVTVTTPEPASISMLSIGLILMALAGGLYKRKHGVRNLA